MKPFVWKNVLRSYSEGIIFAIAKNLNQAREIAVKMAPDWMQADVASVVMTVEPEVHTGPWAYSMYGGD